MDGIKSKYSENDSTWTLLCGPCGIVTRDIDVVKFHGSWKHVSGKNKCRQCGKVATTAVKIEVHKMKVHESSSTRPQLGKVSTWALSCGACAVVLKDRGNIKTHEGCKHKGRGNKCRCCAKGVRSKANLGNHVVEVHESAESGACDIVATTGVKLELHMMKVQKKIL